MMAAVHDALEGGLVCLIRDASVFDGQWRSLRTRSGLKQAAKPAILLLNQDRHGSRQIKAVASDGMVWPGTIMESLVRFSAERRHD